MDPQRVEMLRVNVRQREFYDRGFASDLRSIGNPITRAWRWLRRRQQELRASLDVDRSCYAAHVEWMGDLSNKRVLDLGCFTGNPLSDHLARNAAVYVAVDLSADAMRRRSDALRSMGLDHATALTMDVLTPEFKERYTDYFDLIYAHSVLHHFQHLDLILEDARAWLRDGGGMITLDPLKTAWSMRLARWFYRPLQSDRAWEHPFGDRQLKQIAAAFSVEQVHGMMGRAKWALPFFLIWPGLGRKLGQRWVHSDRANCDRWGSGIRTCLQLSLHLRK